MKKKARIRRVAYEDLGATYQVVGIALLNQVLKAHGISDKRNAPLVRAILETRC